MSKSEVFCVGFDVPGDAFRYVSYDSEASLLDADIVLYEVGLDYYSDYGRSEYQGQPSLSSEGSVRAHRSLGHWKKQLRLAFDTGKTIFLFLRSPVEVYAHTGSQELSGTGRSQKVIHHVSLIDSYMAVPILFDSMIPAKGKKTRLTDRGRILSTYWKAVQDISSYEVYYEHKESIPLMTTKSGSKTVASLIQGKAGNILLLPPLDFSSENFTRYDEKKGQTFWAEEALKFGHSLFSAVVEIHRSLRTGSARSPAPEWVLGSQYELPGESEATTRIETLDDEISKLHSDRAKWEDILEEESLPRCLLYESGQVLEAAIIDALRTIGFKAERYVDDESEFDIIFESTEGRFLGEAEGKETSAINIDKIQQLERNIQEDFAKDHVHEYAKGAMFGNPHRLTRPCERKHVFTEKALSASKRSGFALIHTPDLFPIVQYLKRKKDAAFSKKVRSCFKRTKGELVVFPSVPKTKKKTVTEQRNAPDKK